MRARAIAPARPAGPPPTKRISIGTASASGGSLRIRRSSGSGAWWTIGMILSSRSGIGGGSGGLGEAILMVFLGLAHCLGERRNHLEHVADDSVVGDLEDRRIFVLVDGDDRLRRAHAGEMLYRARDSDSDVKLGTHQTSGLSNLIAVRTPAVVSDSACRPDGGVAKCGREIFDELEILGCLEAPTTSDDDGCFGQVELLPAALLRLYNLDASRPRVDRRLRVFDAACFGVLSRRDHVRPHADDGWRSRHRDGRDDLADVHRVTDDDGVAFDLE